MNGRGLKPLAIIFDMDGVIIDSMPYHYISWYEALRPYGIRANVIEVYEREGEKWQKTLNDLLRRENIKPTRQLLNKIILAKRKSFKKYFKRYLFDGISEFVDCMKFSGYLLAVVTGTPHN